MTGKGAVDNTMNHWLDIGANAINDATYRLRALLHVQHAVNTFWEAHPWQFKVGEADVVCIVPGTGPMPADFGAFGQNGCVTNDTYSLRRHPGGLRELLRRRDVETVTTSQPQWYELGGVLTDGTQQIELMGRLAANVTVHMRYDRKAPTILDSDTSSLLEMIPAEYHSDVIFWGAVANLMFGEGDGRSEMMEAKFVRGIQRAWADQAPVNEARIMWPRFGLRGRRR